MLYEEFIKKTLLVCEYMIDNHIPFNFKIGDVVSFDLDETGFVQYLSHYGHLLKNNVYLFEIINYLFNSDAMCNFMESISTSNSIPYLELARTIGEIQYGMTLNTTIPFAVCKLKAILKKIKPEAPGIRYDIKMLQRYSINELKDIRVINPGLLRKIERMANLEHVLNEYIDGVRIRGDLTRPIETMDFLDYVDLIQRENRAQAEKVLIHHKSECMSLMGLDSPCISGIYERGKIGR